MKYSVHFVRPAGFSDHLTDQSSDKESGSGSQTDLRKIPSLPAPNDFLSNAGPGSGTMPKLMTPDAFMTPSTSVGTLTSLVYCYPLAFMNGVGSLGDVWVSLQHDVYKNTEAWCSFAGAESIILFVALQHLAPWIAPLPTYRLSAATGTQQTQAHNPVNTQSIQTEDLLYLWLFGCLRGTFM